MRTQYSLSNTCDVITFSPHSRLPQNYHNYTRAVMLNLHFLNKVIYLRSHITKFECLYPSAFKQLFHDFAFYDMTPGAESTADLERAVELARKKIYDDIKCRHSKLDFNEFAQVGIKYYWGYYFDMCDNLEFDAGTYMIPNSDRMQLQQIAILRDLLITALFRRCGMVE